MKFIFIFLFIVVNIFSYKSVFAENYKSIEHVPLVKETKGVVSFTDYITGIYKFFIASVFVAALLMITIGGYFYIISAGNQARAGHAKEIIWNAVIGLLVVLFVGILFGAINGNILEYKLSSNLVKIFSSDKLESESMSNFGGNINSSGEELPLTGNEIADKAYQEYVRWGKGSKHECDSDMVPIIKEYYNHTDSNFLHCSKQPWSAAFISYVVPGLKGAAHATYINRAYRGEGNWKFNDPTKYEIKVGDVICYTRDTGRFNPNKFYKSHCDIVHSINGNTAKVIGGNVGNTVSVKTVKLKDGKLVGSYITVLSQK